jgi:hypothetical protein
MAADKPATWAPKAWRTPEGGVVACVEKLKVMDQNLREIEQACQDALEDGVLMGCSEEQIRQVLHAIVDGLENPYRK